MMSCTTPASSQCRVLSSSGIICQCMLSGEHTAWAVLACQAPADHPRLNDPTFLLLLYLAERGQVFPGLHSQNFKKGKRVWCC